MDRAQCQCWQIWSDHWLFFFIANAVSFKCCDSTFRLTFKCQFNELNVRFRGGLFIPKKLIHSGSGGGGVAKFYPIFWNICYNINFVWTNNLKASHLLCGSWILCVHLFWLFWTFIILERVKICSTVQLLWIFLHLRFHSEDASTLFTEKTGATGKTHQMKLFSKKKKVTDKCLLNSLNIYLYRIDTFTSFCQGLSDKRFGIKVIK